MPSDSPPQILCLFLFSAVLLWSTPFVRAADLDAAQEAARQVAVTALRQAEADLQAAQASAGTVERPARGSQLRLTNMRLDSARQRLNQASSALDKLPDSHPVVASLKTRLSQAMALADEILGIITPREAVTTEAAAPPAPVPPPPAPRLNPRQETALRHARSTLQEVEDLLEGVLPLVAQVEKSLAGVLHRDVRSALERLDEAGRKLGFATNHLSQVPAGHPEVQYLQTRRQSAGTQLDQFRTLILESAEKVLAKVTGIGNYPDFEEDFVLLQDLARRYTNFHASAEDSATLAQIIEENPYVMELVTRMQALYQPLIDQRTAEGQRFERLSQYFQRQYATFSSHLANYRQTLPQEFANDLVQADRLAQMAVENQRPAFFGPDGGVTQRLGFAEDKLVVLRALGGPAAEEAERQLHQTRLRMQQSADALAAQIIRDNFLPEDRYRGPDRETVVAVAIDGWSYQQEDAEVLKVVIPGQAWTRDTRWEWSGTGFRKIDRSRLQVILAVRYSEQTAVLRAINVHKNHLQEDSLTGHPLFAFDEPVTPQQLILLNHL